MTDKQWKLIGEPRPQRNPTQCVGPTKRGKGTQLMVVADGAGTPLGVCVATASPSEVTLWAPTLDSLRLTRRWGRPPAAPRNPSG